MDIEKIYDTLTKEIDSSKVYKNEPMAKHTSFKIGGNADIFVKANTIADIASTLKIAKESNIPVYVIGNGSNILVKDNGIRGIVLSIMLDKIDIYEVEGHMQVNAESGVKLSYLAQLLLKKEITGFEFASRNTRHNWRSHKNECRSSRKRNERCCIKNNIYGL